MDPNDNHFAAEWLSLREPADAAARSEVLLDQLKARFEQTSLAPKTPDFMEPRTVGQDILGLNVVDLGSGHGSNLRYLAPRLGRAQRWLLIDHDSDLLARAALSLPGSDPHSPPVAIRTRQMDLARMDWACLDQACLVTASALLDLASRSWIQTLATECFKRRVAALFCLTVDGRRYFTDPSGRRMDHASDAMLGDWFNQHQRRPKGLESGLAAQPGNSPQNQTESSLGPEAASALPAALLQAGFRIATHASDWQLRAGQPGTADLGKSLLDGWRQAALEIEPAQSMLINRWHQRRLTALVNGQIGITIGHVDVLALPPDD